MFSCKVISDGHCFSSPCVDLHKRPLVGSKWEALLSAKQIQPSESHAPHVITMCLFLPK